MVVLGLVSVLPWKSLRLEATCLLDIDAERERFGGILLRSMSGYWPILSTCPAYPAGVARDWEGSFVSRPCSSFIILFDGNPIRGQSLLSTPVFLIHLSTLRSLTSATPLSYFF